MQRKEQPHVNHQELRGRGGCSLPNSQCVYKYISNIPNPLLLIAASDDTWQAFLELSWCTCVFVSVYLSWLPASISTLILLHKQASLDAGELRKKNLLAIILFQQISPHLDVQKIKLLFLLLLLLLLTVYLAACVNCRVSE